VLVNILIVLGCVAGAVGFLFAVTRASPTHQRKESNDFTGAVVAVIGTTYAVLLAFMLSGVWNLYEEAQVNAEQEANDLVNVYRISEQLEAPTQEKIRGLSLQYAKNAIETEFPALNKETLPPQGGQLVEALWKEAGQVKVTTANEQIALSELMTTLRSLTEHRRIRIMQSREMLPPILWAVLIAGGIITVSAACFFGVPNFRFHLLQVMVLSFLIALVLVAIADIDRPYQGDVKVSPDGFEFAMQTFGSGAQ
jgi:hypothetical protein